MWKITKNETLLTYYMRWWANGKLPYTQNTVHAMDSFDFFQWNSLKSNNTHKHNTYTHVRSFSLTHVRSFAHGIPSIEGNSMLSICVQCAMYMSTYFLTLLHHYILAKLALCMYTAAITRTTYCFMYTILTRNRIEWYYTSTQYAYIGSYNILFIYL